jgi:glycosyltransferase involved in cell wall biosynthesis
MKIIFSSFQGLANDQLRGMARHLYPLISKLPEGMEFTYYVGEYTNSKPLKNVKPVSLKYLWIKRILFKCVRLIDQPIMNQNYRRWFEVLYDYFLSKHITSGCTLIYTSLLEKTAKKNKNLGGENIFLSGNPDDQAIYNVVVNNMKLYNVNIRDVYTDLKRVNRTNRCNELADKVIINTQSQFETYSLSIPKNKLYFKEYAIEPNYNLFNNKEDFKKDTTFTYSYIAHNAWLKGLIYLLEAWEYSNINNAQLKIAGAISTDMKRFIDLKFSSLENVQFLGYVDKPHNFIKQSNIIVVPSLLDAAPVTVIESLACDRPVICSDGCGSKSLINSKNGIVFKAGDIKSLSNSLITARTKFSKSQRNLLEKSNQEDDYHSFVFDLIFKQHL